MLRINGTATKVEGGKRWIFECEPLGFHATCNDKMKLIGLLLHSLCDWIGEDPIVMWVDEENFELIFSEPKNVMSHLIKFGRIKSKLSLSKMCSLLGTQSKTTVAQYETGKHSPGISKICELFDVLGYDVKLELVRHKRTRKSKQIAS